MLDEEVEEFINIMSYRYKRRAEELKAAVLTLVPFLVVGIIAAIIGATI